MADVSVEFGAQDTGLENTLKTIQDQLVKLDGELKTGTLSFDEINKKMREAAQAEKLHASLGGTKDQIEALNLSFKQTKPEVEKFTEGQKEIAQETKKASTSFQTMAGEMFELKAALENGNLSADEFDKTLRRLNKLEDIQQKMDAFKQSTTGAGNAAAAASPKADELGQKTEGAGKKAQNAGGLFDSSFAKIAGAFTVGNIAAKGFEKIIDGVFTAARAVVDGFGQALDLGGRLDDLSKRTGETAGKLLVLENAFVEAGISADQVGTVINKLQNFMVDAANGGKKQATVMDALGISLADLEGKTPTEQMGVFAGKIAGIEDPAQRAATASEVFGDKLGGKLLPLLTEFNPALDKSRDSVGSLEEIMDENAATFAAAGDTIDRVKGKFAAFAAGILSEVIPEVQNLGTAMEEVDAAGLGQEIGSALVPVLRDFVGLVNEAKLLMDQLSYAEQQVREDTGALGAVYNTTQGALEAFNNGLFDALKYVTPFDESIESLRETFVGYRRDQDGAIVGLNDLGNAAEEAKPKLDALPGAGEALNLEFQNLPQSIETAKESLLNFNSSLDDSVASIDGIADGTVTVKDDFSEISALTAQLPGQNDAFTQSILGTNEQLSLQPGIYADIFQGISDAQAKEEERRLATEQAANKLQASVELQIQLNEAIASGNVEEQARVQKLIDGEAALKRIKELTDQYIATGLGEDEAKQLAKNLVLSELAAKGVKKNSEDAKGGLDGAANAARTVKKAIEDANTAELDQPVKDFKTETADARKQLGKMKEFIGEDLSKMSLSSIVDKLGLDAGQLESSESQLEAIQKFITDLGNEDPANVTPEVDVPGSKDNIAQIKAALEDTKGVDATPQIDQESVKQQASTARKAVEDDLKKVEAEVTVKPKLDKEALKQEVDMAFASSKGTEHLSNIDKLVETIKGFVEKIEGKLPLQALAY